MELGARSLLCVAALLAFVSRARAQDESDDASQDHAWQLDVASGVELVQVFDFDPQLLVDTEVRFAHGSGHGFLLRGFLTPLVEVVEPSMVAVEAGYGYRLRSWEEGQVGLALDLASGPVVGFANASGVCTDGDSGCGPHVYGTQLGAFASMDVVFYATGFNVGLGVTYRMLGTVEGSTDVSPIHVLGALFRLGFGFYGG